MDETHDYDLLIIGGGMVGASLACALAGSGLRAAVVEAVPLRAQEQPSYDDRSIALAYGTRCIFAGMGLWSSLRDVVTPIRCIHVSQHGRFGVTRLAAKDYGLEALGYVVENRELGRVFAQHLKSLDKEVTLFCPARLQALDFGAERVTATVEQDGKTLALRAALVVGADGGRSLVRRLAAVPSREWDYGQSAVIANVTPGRPHDGVAYERFTDSGPLAMLPLGRNRCALVWTVARGSEDELLALDDEAFLSRLQVRFGRRLGTLRKVGRRQAYPLILIRAEHSLVPRLALVGNAARTLHPVAGQGFNLGLRDVAALAEVLWDARRRGEDPGAAAVLRRYLDWRRDDQRRVVAVTDGLVRLFTNPFPPLAWARSLGLALLDVLPPCKRLLARQFMGFAGRQPRLARGLRLEY